MPEEDHEARLEARRLEVASTIESELGWLEEKRDEPAWPAFEPSHAHSRHRYSFGERRSERDEEETRPEQYTDHQAAALWLGNAASIFDVMKRPWLRDAANAYANWTAIANKNKQIY